MAKVIINLDTNHGSKSLGSDDSSVAPALVGLTELELASLMAVALEGMAAMGGKRPSDLLGDNMSWFDRADIVSRVACNDMQARALMGSLQRKGVVQDYDHTKRGKGEAHWVLTEGGINAAQHAWENVWQLDEKLRAHPSISQALTLQGR